MLLKGNHMYDPLIKVPLVIKYPGEGQNRPSSDDEMVNLIDVGPTILRSAGLEVPSFRAGSGYSFLYFVLKFPLIFWQVLTTKYVKLTGRRDPVVWGWKGW